MRTRAKKASGGQATVSNIERALQYLANSETRLKKLMVLNAPPQVIEREQEILRARMAVVESLRLLTRAHEDFPEARPVASERRPRVANFAAGPRRG
jgi:hypothetical protein